ncbi:MAG: hypothetical protein CM15mP120_27880 [Pseudomonadota bacterium]|nr:MAG: hypothetical protein CM15mP120_27880 [Pseudomonadota bacterium]
MKLWSGSWGLQFDLVAFPGCVTNTRGEVFGKIFYLYGALGGEDEKNQDFKKNQETWP